MINHFNTILENIKDFVNKHSLPILGLLIFASFIWLRFIRTRLPKDIPLKYISFLGLCILIYICIVYFIMVKYLINSHNKGKKRLSEYCVEFLYTPLESFDAALKHGWDSNAFVLNLSKKVEYFIKDTNLFYWCLFILPRVILVTILSIDIFFFHQLKYIYYALFLTVPIMLRKYIIYSFKITKKHLVAQLEHWFSHVSTPYVEGVHPDEDPDDPDYEYDPYRNMSLPLGIFVDFQAKNIVYQGAPAEYSYYFSDYYYNVFCKKHNILDKQVISEPYWSFVKHDKNTIYQKKIEEIITLACLIEYYNKTHNNNTMFRYIKIIIFSLYFICWSYILITGLPNVDWIQVALTLWKTVFTEKNPFMN